jgi:hypothetical protein
MISSGRRCQLSVADKRFERPDGSSHLV